MDADYNVICPPRFSSMIEFRDGLFKVAIDKKQGYVDTTGKVVWEPTK